jgi:hypothetical protein
MSEIGAGSTDQERLVEKLRRIEALFADRAATDGERAAAGEARDRIRQRLASFAQTDPPVEYSFPLRNPWSKKLFIALLRRYGIRPYRYARQRHTTVMARVPERFLKETLWPEFLELNRTLQAYLSQQTERIIAESINRDTSDVEVRSGQALPAAGTIETGEESE